MGRHALVDGIPFVMPVSSRTSPALMAAFPLDAGAAANLMPGGIHPLRLPNGRGMLVVTVIYYRDTTIGTYIEFSVAIACTHGRRPVPRLLPGLAFLPDLALSQYVVDLPVSTLISVKGGKGIWGMPKHQANLDFEVEDGVISSQYDVDGELGVRIEIDHPGGPRLPLRGAGVNYCTFRGMLMKSRLRFASPAHVGLFRRARARLYIGYGPRVRQLRSLGVSGTPLFTAYLPDSGGVLDDHIESWFLTSPDPITVRPEGMESVVDLEPSQEWPKPPSALYGPEQRVL
ncbi:acetoacetate decarboxylase [Pseudofrankia asymbiotica]|uniref:Acetoacetate decarboxylase n=2 Tax=Pseudofrankia asymbiotica TaxID=1834516 RepID=A0A1V2I247_9ACTN|nr:acetoacetate decarboxylase [Pseudofrankia asymbiotica]